MSIFCYTQANTTTLSSGTHITRTQDVVSAIFTQKKLPAGHWSAGVFTIGWFFPLRNHHLNEMISENDRATMLSADYMVSSFGAALACFAFYQIGADGPLAPLWRIGSALLALAAVSLLGSLLLRKSATAAAAVAR